MGLYGNTFITENNISKITMGFKIHPHQNLDETFKKHSYIGLLNFVKKCNKLDDLKYLKKDYEQALSTINKIKERIELCEKMGNCSKTEKYYNNIKKKYIDKGITTKDINITLKWYKDVYLKELNNKIEKLKKN